MKTITLSLTIFIIALLPRITTLSGTFIVNDETLYWKWSSQFSQALLNTDWAGTIVGKGYPSITVFWVHGLGIAITYLFKGPATAELWLTEELIFDILGERRLIMGVANALLFGLIFWQSQRLLDRTTAFWGTATMALTPFLLADARTMRGDALMCSFMLICLLSFLIFLREKQWVYLIGSAISFGLAFLTKMTAIPLVGVIVLAMAVWLWRQAELTSLSRLRHGFIVLTVWGGISCVTIVALWPALWVAPLEVVAFMSHYAADSLDGRLNYFWGKLTHDEPLHLFYPNAFLFRATPLMVFGVAVVVLRIVYQTLKQKILTTDAIMWTALALLAYCLIYGWVLDFGALKRDRYLMPIFPAAALLAAVGWVWLIQQMTWRRVAWGIFVALWLAETGHILSTHPFYYTYWSPLMGGGTVAAQAMMAESGVDSAPLVKLSQRPQAGNETVAILTTRDYRPAYVGRTVRTLNSDPWITANYVILRQYHYQTEKLDPDILAYLYRQPPLEVLEFDGYIWAWVYPGPAAQHYAGASLDGKAYLHGYNLSSQTLSASEPLQIKLFWQNRGLQPTEQIYLRLVDVTGFTWLETIAHPQAEFAEVAGQVEAYIESEAELILPPGTPPGQYFLKIGLMAAREEIGQFELPAAAATIAIEPSTAPVETLSGQPLNQPLGPSLRLLTADLPSRFTLNPPTPQSLTLHWQAESDIQTDYTLAVQLWHDGDEAAYWLDRPTHGLYPTQQWQQGEQVRDLWQLDLATAQTKQPLSPGRYQLGLTLFDGSTSQQVAHAQLGPIELIDREHRFTPPPMQHRFEATFADQIHLLGFDLTQRPLTGYAALDLKLYWQTQTPLDTSYTVFSQLLGPDGTVVGQHDGLPAEGRIPTTEWQAGEVIADRHTFDHSTDLVGDYRLIIGLYNSQDGRRLPVTNPPELGGDFVQLHRFRLGES